MRKLRQGVGHPRHAGVALALLLASIAMPAMSEAGETTVPFAALPGWVDDAHDAVFQVFRRSCAHIVGESADIRRAVATPPELRAVCVRALGEPDTIKAAAARRFFERNFLPVRVLPQGQRGFMTGYYEPEFAANPEPTAVHRAALFARPSDLDTLVPYHDRAAIEDGALAGRGLELFWLTDPFEAFLVQVQGSARLRLPDGRIARVAYAGRNGHPYTSVGRVLIERGILAREEVDLPRIRDVFAGDPALARDVMRQNRSFVFFRRLEDHDPALGPIGAQGLPLTPGRSIAIDRTAHPYGLPFFVVGEHPTPDGAIPVRRLAIAQDTGTAIVGPARIDWFAGWGVEAERLAGVLRHPIDLFVLRPRAEPLP